MSKKVAVVICNWNKRNDLLNCIASVLRNDSRLFDVIVVDNASTDGSADAVKEAFRDEVLVIRNEENTGGSGGFNQGMKVVLGQEYEYVCLLDNDVLLNEDAIFSLYSLLESDEKIAAAGAKIKIMNGEGRLQEFGATIDWERFNLSPLYKGEIDRPDLPHTIDSDYVPACAVLVRTGVIRQIGLMDESNFIYWDDVEWFYRMKRLGYRVVAYSQAIVQHKMGAASKSNTFATYYFWRNRIRFFLANLDRTDLDRFLRTIFTEAYQAVYFSSYRGQYSLAQSIIAAFRDALQQVRGVAGPGRIFDREVVDDPLAKIVEAHSRIVLQPGNVPIPVAYGLVNRMLTLKPELEITVQVEAEDRVKFEGNINHTNVQIGLHEASSSDDYVIQLVNHLIEVPSHPLEGRVPCYIDRYGQVASTEEDFRQLEQFPVALEASKRMFLPIIRSMMIQ